MVKERNERRRGREVRTNRGEGMTMELRSIRILDEEDTRKARAAFVARSGPGRQ
jgi:hypothetical protein